mmetsp:Transcript_15887/g.30733  ORF Transcript_15887/g.30733 Transcript_15887/m.30733 type:complete len:155 (+) Transcript_15887:174-638(+)
MGDSKRLRFEHNGQLIYEWEQNLDEVLIYVRPPPGVTGKMIDCKITKTHLTLGIKGNPPFIDEDLGDSCEAGESMWTIDDGEIEINLKKMRKAATWESALRGHGTLDPLAKAEVQKKMTLERFQEEHPGFDFSGAEFSGSAPDPRTFMDGVKYQ